MSPDVEMFRRIAEWMGLPFRPGRPARADRPRCGARPDRAAASRPYSSRKTTSSAVARPRLLAVQQAIWGQEHFRPGQEEIMRDVLAGKDVLTLLPTGAGKSRTYQFRP